MPKGGGCRRPVLGFLRVPDHLGTQYVIWGPLGSIKGQFSVFEDPRPSATQNKMILSIIFLRKTRFFDPKLAQNAHKMGPNGVHWGGGGTKGQFWVFEAPRPSGNRLKMIWSKIFFLRKTRFLTPKSALLPTNWAKMGSTGGVYRVNFGFLRVPDHLGTDKK